MKFYDTNKGKHDHRIYASLANLLNKANTNIGVDTSNPSIERANIMMTDGSRISINYERNKVMLISGVGEIIEESDIDNRLSDSIMNNLIVAVACKDIDDPKYKERFIEEIANLLYSNIHYPTESCSNAMDTSYEISQIIDYALKKDPVLVKKKGVSLIVELVNPSINKFLSAINDQMIKQNADTLPHGESK